MRNHVKIYPWRFVRSARESYLDSSKTPYTDRYNINEFNHNKRKKPWMEVIPKERDNRYNAYKWNDSYRSDPKEAKETAFSKLSRFQQSLKDRGSARESEPYVPPAGVQDQVIAIFKELKASELGDDGSMQLGTSDDDITKFDLYQSKALRFKFITGCIEHFNHNMPSSYLNDMASVGDVIEYFSTPVRGINPYEALNRESESLPTNLSLIAEPDRFNKDSDQFFGGYNAFPGIVSKVPGLRASKKYPVFNQDEFQWPDV